MIIKRNISNKYTSEMFSKIGKKTCQTLVLIDKSFPSLNIRPKEDDILKKYDEIFKNYQNINNEDVKQNIQSINLFKKNDLIIKNSLWVSNLNRKNLNKLETKNIEQHNYLGIKRKSNFINKNNYLKFKEIKKNEKNKSYNDLNYYIKDDYYKNIKGFKINKQLKRKHILNISYDKNNNQFSNTNINNYEPRGYINFNKKSSYKKNYLRDKINTVYKPNYDYNIKKHNTIINPIRLTNNNKLYKNDIFYDYDKKDKILGYISFNKISKRDNCSNLPFYLQNNNNSRIKCLNNNDFKTKKAKIQEKYNKPRKKKFNFKKKINYKILKMI